MIEAQPWAGNRFARVRSRGHDTLTVMRSLWSHGSAVTAPSDAKDVSYTFSFTKGYGSTSTTTLPLS